jgi:hypothetical protein
MYHLFFEFQALASVFTDHRLHHFTSTIAQLRFEKSEAKTFGTVNQFNALMLNLSAIELIIATLEFGR